MTASGQLSRPPAGTFVTAYGQSLVSVVITISQVSDALFELYPIGTRAGGLFLDIEPVALPPTASS